MKKAATGIIFRFFERRNMQTLINKTKTQQCRLCGAGSKKKFEANIMALKRIDYYLCPECGFLQTEYPSWLEKAYEKAINDSDRGLLKRNLVFSEKAARIISLFFNPKGKFLDYGGGYGLFAGLMREKGYDFRLYEPYAENLFVPEHSFSGEGGKFDLITSFECFEHFVNPKEELERIFSMTANVLFSTELLPEELPDPAFWPISWAYYGLEHGQHISFYSRKTLEIEAAKRGLKFYTNGFNLHLITEKNIDCRLFSEFSGDTACVGWKAENLGPGSRQAYNRRLKTGFIDKYLKGNVLDIGYKGYEDKNVCPVTPNAIGLDMDYPGYDGKNLPFEDESFDAVYASHTLEHIEDYKFALREWFSKVKTGGYLIIAVPHQYLYEKRRHLPSRWNADHKRFYTPSSLLNEIEQALAPNTYRVRELRDDDEFYDYKIDPFSHAGGGFQIELVIEKIKKPSWDMVEGYEFAYPGFFFNTKKLIDKIEFFLSMREAADVTNPVNLNNAFSLLKELEYFRGYFTLIESNTLKEFREFLVSISDCLERGESPDLTKAETLKESLKKIKTALEK